MDWSVSSTVPQFMSRNCKRYSPAVRTERSENMKNEAGGLDELWPVPPLDLLAGALEVSLSAEGCEGAVSGSGSSST